MNPNKPLFPSHLPTTKRQAKVVKQWLACFSGDVDWIAFYGESQQCCLQWIKTDHLRLNNNTPLYGATLSDITLAASKEEGVQQPRRSHKPSRESSSRENARSHTRSMNRLQRSKRVRVAQAEKPPQRKHSKEVDVVRTESQQMLETLFYQKGKVCNKVQEQPLRNMHLNDPENGAGVKTASAPDSLEAHEDPSEDRESVSAVKRLKPCASLTRLRDWSGKHLPVYESSPQGDAEPDFADSSQKAQQGVGESRLSEPGKRIKRVFSSARRETENGKKAKYLSSCDQQEWVAKPMRRVSNMLTHRKLKLSSQTAWADRENSHAQTSKQGFLLSRQWQSELQEHEVSREQLMRLAGKQLAASTKARHSPSVIPPYFHTAAEAHGQQRVATQKFDASAADKPLVKATHEQNWAESRAQGRKEEHHEKVHERSQALEQDELLVEHILAQTTTAPDRVTEEENLITEKLLKETENHSVDTQHIGFQQDDDALQHQIKRILDEEARRYGIDI